MATTRFRASRWLCALALFGTAAAQAQVPPPNLADFVNNPANGATPLQRAAGRAVQAICSELALMGGPSQPTATRQELFNRCNEMVETSRVLQNVTTPSTAIDRDLGLTGPELLGVMQQVAGEELSAQGVLATRVSSGQFVNISGRLNALRLGTSVSAARGRVASLSPHSDVLSFGPSDLALQRAEGFSRAFYGNDDGSANGSFLKTSLTSLSYAGSDADAAAESTTDGGGARAPSSPWGWFADGSYNRGDRDPSINEDGFDFDAGSFTLGVDYNFGSGVLGASVGYDDYSADFDSNGVSVSGGGVEVTSASGSVFGAWFGERLSLNGILTYGSPDSDVERRVVYTPEPGTCIPPAAPCPAQSRTLIGSPKSDYLAAGATLGFDSKLGSWDFTPSLSVSYRDADIDGYTESDSLPTGGLALRYDEQTIESLRSILSLALSRSFSRSFGVVTPSLRLEWHHEFEDDATQLAAKYAVEDELGTAPDNFGAGCISCFRFASDAPDADFGVAGLGLSFVFAARVQAYVYYEALLGATDLTSNSIAVGLRGQF